MDTYRETSLHGFCDRLLNIRYAIINEFGFTEVSFRNESYSNSVCLPPRRLFLGCQLINPIYLQKSRGNEQTTEYRAWIQCKKTKQKSELESTKAKTWAAMRRTTMKGIASRIQGPVDDRCSFAIFTGER